MSVKNRNVYNGVNTKLKCPLFSKVKVSAFSAKQVIEQIYGTGT